MTAAASWYILWEQSLTLSRSNDGLTRVWKGSDEFGLKQVYGDSGVGEFTLSATLDFPYQGSFEADTAYFFQNVLNVTLEADYRATKD